MGCEEERERVVDVVAVAVELPEDGVVLYVELIPPAPPPLEPGDPPPLPGRKLANEDEVGAEPYGESSPPAPGVVGDRTTMSGGGGGDGDFRNLCGRRLSLKDELGEPGESEAEGIELWVAGV